MSNEEETWEKLDAEFDHYIVDMKPYVLKLPHKLGNLNQDHCVRYETFFHLNQQFKDIMTKNVAFWNFG